MDRIQVLRDKQERAVVELKETVKMISDLESKRDDIQNELLFLSSEIIQAEGNSPCQKYSTVLHG